MVYSGLLQMNVPPTHSIMQWYFSQIMYCTHTQVICANKRQPQEEKSRANKRKKICLINEWFYLEPGRDFFYLRTNPRIATWEKIVIAAIDDNFFIPFSLHDNW